MKALNLSALQELKIVIVLSEISSAKFYRASVRVTTDIFETMWSNVFVNKQGVKMKLTKLLASTLALAFSSIVVAENLTLTKVELSTDSSQGNCHTDILDVPEGVKKYYVAMGKKSENSNYFECHVYLVHDKAVNLNGKAVKYLSFETHKLGGYSGNGFSVATPESIKTEIISKN